MDHPAFVITGEDGSFEFRGGIDAPYFERAGIAVVSRMEGPRGRVRSYDPESSTGTARFVGDVAPGDIAMWRFANTRQRQGLLRAPACDDLAGVAAALAAFDRARGGGGRHFGVLLTLAERGGLVGGKLEPGEDYLATGKRELLEETGYVAREWCKLGLIHNAIGYSDEGIEIWLARGLERRAQQLAEGEFLEVFALPLAEAQAMARDGRITDVKTIAGLLLAEAPPAA